MKALCERCGAMAQWRARRGARLADLRCVCGGTLRLPPRRPHPRGYQLPQCAACGIRRRTAMPAPVTCLVLVGGHPVVVPAGAPACPHHWLIGPSGKLARTGEGQIVCVRDLSGGQGWVKVLEIYADTRGKGRCRSCGAAIEWAEVVASGRKMPFDAEIVPVSCRREPETHRLIEVVDLTVSPSHFASCPDAARWRRVRSAGR
jgi:hypothetical protein